MNRRRPSIYTWCISFLRLTLQIVSSSDCGVVDGSCCVSPFSEILISSISADHKWREKGARYTGILLRRSLNILTWWISERCTWTEINEHVREKLDAKSLGVCLDIRNNYVFLLLVGTTHASLSHEILRSPHRLSHDGFRPTKRKNNLNKLLTNTCFWDCKCFHTTHECTFNEPTRSSTKSLRECISAVSINCLIGKRLGEEMLSFDSREKPRVLRRCFVCLIAHFSVFLMRISVLLVALVLLSVLFCSEGSSPSDDLPFTDLSW